MCAWASRRNMVSTHSRIPMAVPQFRGCTIRLSACSMASAASQKSRCWSATITQIRSGGTTRRARSNACWSSVMPPFSEQYCLGTTRPCRSVVNAARRVPSPPASTTAQVLFPDTARLPVLRLRVGRARRRFQSVMRRSMSFTLRLGPQCFQRDAECLWVGERGSARQLCLHHPDR